MEKGRALLATCLFLLTVGQVDGGLSCIDETGKQVSWWWLLKHPKKDVNDTQDGRDYVYMTSDTAAKGFQAGSKKVSDPTSLLGQVLQGVYSGSVSNYMFYNDQLPNKSWSQDYGHSKGYMAWDDASAFWVQHSIPKFPNYVKDGYLFGDGQTFYGQHAFCMTLTKDNVDTVAEILKFVNPWVYDHKTDGSLKNVEDILQGKVVKDGTAVQEMVVPWGTVRLYGKTEVSEDNMLQAVITPDLKLTVLAQSWLNGGDPFGSYCPHSGFNVLDIEQVKLSTETHDTHKDHSKWAVAKAASSKWMCGLDNNHVHSQLNRSGLAVCMEEVHLSEALRAAAVQVNACGGPSPSPTPPPGKCCYYHDKSCAKGVHCCAETGKPYGSEGSCKKFGGKHGCQWTGSDCVVNGTPPLDVFVM